MLNGELIPRRRLNGDLTGGVFYGTNDYNELINRPSINSVELVGNKTLEDLGIEIPTATSELTNDSGFITSADVPTKTSDLVNDSGFITSAAVPTKTSDLVNDSGFITSAAVPTKTSDLTNDSGFINLSDIPENVSYYTNDAGYITENDVAAVAISGDYDDLTNKPENLSDFNNDCGFIGFTELTDTLTAGNTSITISDDVIEATSTIDIYADVFGIQPTNAVVATGSITLTFLTQASDITVKVRVS